MSKIMTARQAVRLLRDGDTVAVSGFGAYCPPDALYHALSDRFMEEGHPAGLTLVAGICNGDNTWSRRGLNLLAKDGLLETVIAAHMGNSPGISQLIAEERCAGYALPLGVLANLIKASAAGRSGFLTRVGLGTFADPRQEGCCLNRRAREQGHTVVELTELGGGEQLFYPAFPIHACLIRGTWADEDGNISVAKEPLTGLDLEMAEAVHKTGGVVIVQVEKIVARSSIHPRQVRIHHSLVDAVVVAPAELHRQCYGIEGYLPEITGEVRCPADAIAPMEMGIRKVIARRAAMELQRDTVVNLGIGLPSGVGSVANEEGIGDWMTLSLESGPIGGVPLEGLGFAGAVNPESIPCIGDVFDLYDGGFLNQTFLGAAEVDEKGNVNVSRFGSRCTGPGGFINISQNTKTVCFLLSFTAGKSEIAISDGQLRIVSDGEMVKFKRRVQQITFSADYARENGQRVLYITERAVFRLGTHGLELIELAPGVDLERDVLSHMEFRPEIGPEVREMDPRIFRDRVMGLAEMRCGE